MPSSKVVEMAVAVAGLIVPAWPIWRIRRRYISIPISALLSCWLLMTWVCFAAELNPGGDGFGAGVAIFSSPGFGLGYAVVLAGIRAATRRAQPPAFERRDAVKGLVVWASLCAFGLVYPFVAPPPTRRGDALFLSDYFFFCGPLVLLAVVMSVTYALRLFHLWRVPSLLSAEEQAAGSGATARL